MSLSGTHCLQKKQWFKLLFLLALIVSLSFTIYSLVYVTYLTYVRPNNRIGTNISTTVRAISAVNSSSNTTTHSNLQSFPIECNLQNYDPVLHAIALFKLEQYTLNALWKYDSNVLLKVDISNKSGNKMTQKESADTTITAGSQFTNDSYNTTDKWHIHEKSSGKAANISSSVNFDKAHSENLAANKQRFNTADQKPEVTEKTFNLNICNGKSTLLLNKSVLLLLTTMYHKKDALTIFNNTLTIWSLLMPDIQPVLFITDKDIVQKSGLLIYRACQLGWVVEVSPKIIASGYPVLKTMFQYAKLKWKTPWIGYANADILFTYDLARILRSLTSLPNGPNVQFVSSRRYNSVVNTETHISTLKEVYRIAQYSKLAYENAIDYFLYKYDCPLLEEMPEFVVGRRGFDNWLVYQAISSGTQSLDITYISPAVHQGLQCKNNVVDSHQSVKVDADYNIKLATGINWYERGHTFCMQYQAFNVDDLQEQERNVFTYEIELHNSRSNDYTEYYYGMDVASNSPIDNHVKDCKNNQVCSKGVNRSSTNTTTKHTYERYKLSENYASINVTEAKRYNIKNILNSTKSIDQSKSLQVLSKDKQVSYVNNSAMNHEMFKKEDLQISTSKNRNKPSSDARICNAKETKKIGYHMNQVLKLEKSLKYWLNQKLINNQNDSNWSSNIMRSDVSKILNDRKYLQFKRCYNHNDFKSLNIKFLVSTKPSIFHIGKRKKILVRGEVKNKALNKTEYVEYIFRKRLVLEKKCTQHIKGSKESKKSASALFSLNFCSQMLTVYAVLSVYYLEGNFIFVLL